MGRACSHNRPGTGSAELLGTTRQPVRWCVIALANSPPGCDQKVCTQGGKRNQGIADEDNNSNTVDGWENTLSQARVMRIQRGPSSCWGSEACLTCWPAPALQPD
jgi:hypothetical protein